MSDPGSHTPAALRWAVRLLFLQAVGLAVVTGFVGYAATTQTALSVATAVSTVALPLGVAILFAALAWQLRRRRAWARGAAIVLELLMVLVGGTLISSGLAWAGVPVVALGLIGAGLLLAPSSREALGIH